MPKSLFFALAATCVSAWAQVDAPSLATRTLLLGSLAGLRPALEDRGVTIGLNYTHEVLGVVAGGIERSGEYNGMIQLDLELDLEKSAGWKGATLHATGLAAFGPSLSTRAIGDDSNVSNINVRNGVRLFEAWLQQRFGEWLSVRAGMLAADSEFFGSTCDPIRSPGGLLFINSDFGAIPILSLNVPEPIYPISAPGISATMNATRALTFRTAIYSGQPVPANQFDDRNPNGFEPRLDSSDGALVLAELEYATGCAARDESAGSEDQQTTAPRGLGGNFRLGVFHHSGTFTRWEPDRNLRGNRGVYASLNHQLWRENETDHQGLSLFGHAGYALADRNVLDLCFDAGLIWHGAVPGRDADHLGVGVSLKRYSRDFSDAQQRAGAPGRDREIIVEAIYSAQVAPWLVIQPDVQFVVQPAGQRDLENALVAGVRMSIDF